MHLILRLNHKEYLSQSESTCEEIQWHTGREEILLEKVNACKAALNALSLLRSITYEYESRLELPFNI